MTDFSHHVEVEDWLVGAAITTDLPLAARITSGIDDRDLQRPDSRMVLAAVRRLVAAGEIPDEVAVVRQMRKDKTLGRGGAAAVATLAARTPVIAATATRHIDTLRENARRRRLYELAGRLMSASTDESQDVDELTDKAVATLARRAGPSSEATTTLGAVLEQAYMALAEETPDTDRVSWPLDWLDRRAGGQRPGWLVISAGWTSMGKSWFGLDCTEAALRQGARVLYDTEEMPASEIGERMLARGGVDLGALQTGGQHRSGERMTDAEYQAAYARWQELEPAWDRCTITSGMSVDRLIALLAAAAATRDPYRYVVIDTINLIDLPAGQSRRERIDEGLKRLKAAAVRYGATVHVQAQLARAEEKRRRPPRLQDLKESGGLEQIGDVVLFVHRHEDELGVLGERAELVLAKARSAPLLGGMPARWDSESYRFVPAVRHGLGVRHE